MKKLFTGMVVAITFFGIVLLSLPTILHSVGLHPEYHGPNVTLPGKRALVITTSHSVLAAPGETEGDPTGVFGSEMTHPYYTFLDGGMDVDIASVAGGEIPIDPSSFYFMIKTPEDERYLNDPIAQAYDLAQSPVLAAKVSEAYYGSKEAVIGGVCHGVLGLVNARDRNGDLLIAGRLMTGVTDKQIQELGIDLTPKHPETELRKAGVIFESQTAFLDFFATHVTVDDEQRFVTGQNQNSGLEAAHTIMRILSERD